MSWLTHVKHKEEKFNSIIFYCCIKGDSKSIQSLGLPEIIKFIL